MALYVALSGVSGTLKVSGRVNEQRWRAAYQYQGTAGYLRRWTRIVRSTPSTFRVHPPEAKKMVTLGLYLISIGVGVLGLLPYLPVRKLE